MASFAVFTTAMSESDLDQIFEMTRTRYGV
jgi:hypothetical protein